MTTRTVSKGMIIIVLCMSLAIAVKGIYSMYTVDPHDDHGDLVRRQQTHDALIVGVSEKDSITFFNDEQGHCDSIRGIWGKPGDHITVVCFSEAWHQKGMSK